MFPSTSSRETLGLFGKKNQLFPSGPYIKGILLTARKDHLTSQAGGLLTKTMKTD